MRMINNNPVTKSRVLEFVYVIYKTASSRRISCYLVSRFALALSGHDPDYKFYRVRILAKQAGCQNWNSQHHSQYEGPVYLAMFPGSGGYRLHTKYYRQSVIRRKLSWELSRKLISSGNWNIYFLKTK
jgi:hypothetical protein